MGNEKYITFDMGQDELKRILKEMMLENANGIIKVAGLDPKAVVIDPEVERKFATSNIVFSENITSALAFTISAGDEYDYYVVAQYAMVPEKENGEYSPCVSSTLFRSIKDREEIYNIEKNMWEKVSDAYPNFE